MGETVGPRQFNITPKLTAADITQLATVNTLKGKDQLHFLRPTVQIPIAKAIIANFRELQAGVPEGEIINLAWANINDGGSRRKVVTGELGVANSVATSVASIGHNLEWGMSTPEMVYMSGYYFSFVLGATVDQKNAYLQRINDREIIYPTDEAKEADIAKTQGEIARLLTFRGRISETLADYAEQYLSNVPGYTAEQYADVLENLLFLSRHTEANNYRPEILEHIKAGRLQEAQALLQLR